MRLSEKHRPTTFAGVVGQDKAVATLSRLSPGGRAYWITGKSGTGKTTLARILAAQVADGFEVTEIVGRQLTVAVLKEMAFRWNYVAMGERGGYALIVNEAHGLGKATVEVMLDVLENLRDNVTVIFTTTNDGESELFEDHIDAGPFVSRCICVKLTNQGITKPFAARLREIAIAEGLDGKSESEYVKLVSACGQNFRECLGRIEAGEMLG